jgi:hypothetical protein
VGGGFELHLLIGHAVRAPEIAGICQGNPEVVMYASEAVFEHVLIYLAKIGLNKPPFSLLPHQIKQNIHYEILLAFGLRRYLPCFLQP